MNALMVILIATDTLETFLLYSYSYSNSNYYSRLKDKEAEASIASTGYLIISFEVCASANTSSMFRRA